METRSEDELQNEAIEQNSKYKETESEQSLNVRTNQSIATELGESPTSKAVREQSHMKQRFADLREELIQEMGTIVKQEIEKKVEAIVSKAKLAIGEEMESLHTDFSRSLNTLLSEAMPRPPSSEDIIQSILSCSPDRAIELLNETNPAELSMDTIPVHILDALGFHLIQLVETKSIQSACLWLQYVLARLPANVLKQDKYSDAILFTRNPLMKQVRDIYSNLLSNLLPS